MGMGLTAWRYMWRITPMRRVEMEDDGIQPMPPSIPADFDRERIQGLDDGVGPLFHRRYRTTIVDGSLPAEEIMAQIQQDPNLVAPTEFARFLRSSDRAGAMQLGDEYLVRMPGPWDGPVRVVDVTSTSFRFVTLRGHLEAGQIEFRAHEQAGLHFEIESWARSGDRLSHLLYDQLHMAKEVQLHMWTSVLENVVRLTKGRRSGLISIETRMVPWNG
ncbi:hypothetical protein BH18ACT16_BH18ACT16_05220 [soil metagenome]